MLFLLYIYPLFCGAVAQLGERMAGSHEVRGSIPLSSTNFLIIPVSHNAKLNDVTLL